MHGHSPLEAKVTARHMPEADARYSTIAVTPFCGCRQEGHADDSRRRDERQGRRARRSMRYRDRFDIIDTHDDIGFFPASFLAYAQQVSADIRISATARPLRHLLLCLA